MENENTEYIISCPYCLKEFSHEAVEFRSNHFYKDETEVGEADDNVSARNRDFFLLKESEKYTRFWEDYGGQSTESDEDSVCDEAPRLLPILPKDLIKKINKDRDGMVVSATDVYGHETARRVCPHCNNPLPQGYGKQAIKRISIIGITGAGKTVYISQLLKGLDEYANKCGLNAFATSDHERKFIQANPVKQGVGLPTTTPKLNFSQPMFFDIVRSDSIGDGRKTDTIVIYDIAGENCKDSNAMAKFGKFIKESDGLIVLIDPKQLDFVPSSNNKDDETVNTALKTLHNVIVTENNRKCEIPIAVCISKSDMCEAVLPGEAFQDVQVANLGFDGLPTQEFNAKDYNVLSATLTELFKNKANLVCNTLRDEYVHYNFFSVCAIGCDVENNRPLYEPEPKRIEEPIFWLFKRFGYIKANDKVKIPFPMQREKIEYKEIRKFLRKKIVPEKTTIDIYDEETLDQYLFEQSKQGGVL